MNAMCQVLYREDGVCDKEREPGVPYPAVILERWAANSGVHHIVTVGWRELTQWGDAWASAPTTTLLAATSNAAAIRYAIEQYDLLAARVEGVARVRRAS